MGVSHRLYCYQVVRPPQPAQGSRMRTCPRRCSRMLSTAPPRPWRSTTLRRTLQPTSRRSLTKSTTPPGTALSAGTLVPMSLTRPDISSTSTLAKWQYFSSRADRSPPTPRAPPTPPHNHHNHHNPNHRECLNLEPSQ